MSPLSGFRSGEINARNEKRTCYGKEPIFRYDLMDPQYMVNSITS